jgi:hypothetical protein
MKSGDPCDVLHCDGIMRTSQTHRMGNGDGKKYLRCPRCGATGIKVLEAKVVTNQPRRDDVEPMLLDVRGAGQAAGMTPKEILMAAGRGDFPAPMFVAGRARWNAAQLEAWIANGCPRGERMNDADFSKLLTSFIDVIRGAVGLPVAESIFATGQSGAVWSEG